MRSLGFLYFLYFLYFLHFLSFLFRCTSRNLTQRTRRKATEFTEGLGEKENM
jgi:hypothetical protein